MLRRRFPELCASKNGRISGTNRKLQPHDVPCLISLFLECIWEGVHAITADIIGASDLTSCSASLDLMLLLPAIIYKSPSLCVVIIFHHHHLPATSPPSCCPEIINCSTPLHAYSPPQAAFSTYAAAFGLVFLLSSHPRHEAHDKVQNMTAASFYSLCLHDGSAEAQQAASASNDVTYVVYFYTDWSAQ